MVAATAGIQRGLSRVEIQEMTENEKAATFIGWSEDDIYVEGINGFPKPTPAPDMTDPGNYMKALETVDALEIIFQQYDGLNFCIFKGNYREKVGDTPTAYGFDERSWGDAVVIALAALYDADNARMKG